MSTATASNNIASAFIAELEHEAATARKCLERIPSEKFDWKPHEKSMQLGYLAQLVADIPRWIQYTIENGEIDFATYEQFKGGTAAELVAHFDKSVEGAKKALANVTDEDLNGTFYLRHGEKELFNSPKDESIMQSLNHLVHHRGQLSVYLRMNDLPIPSIYGPSGDSGGF